MGFIFICMTTCAVHLEHCSGPGAEPFLSALDRFINRRGKPGELRSDRGSAFVNLAAQQDKTVQAYADELSAAVFAKYRIELKFNPPGAPPFRRILGKDDQRSEENPQISFGRAWQVATRRFHNIPCPSRRHPQPTPYLLYGRWKCTHPCSNHCALDQQSGHSSQRCAANPQPGTNTCCRETLLGSMDSISQRFQRLKFSVASEMTICVQEIKLSCVKEAIHSLTRGTSPPS